ncbi:hypothetical protein [Phyllobacterium myrsinacearum]|uniref:Uncharacterized protein n=1 Tax=Phyllobacterium myrsinacearum TaxID=28101 RepID=A0A839EXT9_9HYPH|nr:hypothetical protein [Phyllobacterium myrsinacearum]MBA8882096.1 hypothetical protein [Phyllobacterium myrsinacearum]
MCRTKTYGDALETLLTALNLVKQEITIITDLIASDASAGESITLAKKIVRPRQDELIAKAEIIVRELRQLVAACNEKQTAH